MGDIYLINFAEPQASAPSLLKKAFGASFTISKFGYLVYSQHDESDAVTDEIVKAYPSDDAPDFVVSRGYAGWLDQSIWDAVEKFETAVTADANLQTARTEFNPIYQKLETLKLSLAESLKTENPNYEALSSTTTGMGTLINELKGLHDKLPSPEVAAPFDSLCQKLEAIQQRSFTALAVTRRGLLGIKTAKPRKRQIAC